MNDKQQLAAMGEHMAEQQPMCMAKRIEELEAQVRVMADLLRDAFAYIDDDQDHCIQTGKPQPDNCSSLLSRIDALLDGQVPDPVMPEDWRRNKYYPLWITTESGKNFYVEVDRKSGEVSVGGDADSTDAAKIFLRSLGDLSPVVVPKGRQLVPVEPTAYQVLVGRNAKPTDDELCVTIYRAMLAAAPKPEAK